jgi:hypothetical protein
MDLQSFFCGPDWMYGEVDSFFVYVAYWLRYYEKAYDKIGSWGLEIPPDLILDDPNKFHDWFNKMVEVKRNEMEHGKK